MGPQGIFRTQRFLHSIVRLMPRDEPILPKTWYEQDDSESERPNNRTWAEPSAAFLGRKQVTLQETDALDPLGCWVGCGDVRMDIQYRVIYLYLYVYIDGYLYIYVYVCAYVYIFIWIYRWK